MDFHAKCRPCFCINMLSAGSNLLTKDGLEMISVDTMRRGGAGRCREILPHKVLKLCPRHPNAPSFGSSLDVI